jgi:hypothetical protein
MYETKWVDVDSLMRYARPVGEDDLWKLARERTGNQYVLLFSRDWSTVKELVAAYKEYQQSYLDWRRKETELLDRIRTLERRVADLENQMAYLERRLEGHRKAVRKWRVKAGVDVPPGTPEVVGAERVRRRKGKQEEWHYLVHVALPVERNPHLAREAWEAALSLVREEHLDRVYYHQQQGWVMAYRARW